MLKQMLSKKDIDGWRHMIGHACQQVVGSTPEVTISSCMGALENTSGTQRVLDFEEKGGAL